MSKHPTPRRPKHYRKDDAKQRIISSKAAIEIYDALDRIGEGFGGFSTIGFRPRERHFFDFEDHEAGDFQDDRSETHGKGLLEIRLNFPCRYHIFDDVIGVLADRQLHEDVDRIMERHLKER